MHDRITRRVYAAIHGKEIRKTLGSIYRHSRFQTFELQLDVQGLQIPEPLHPSLETIYFFFS